MQKFLVRYAQGLAGAALICLGVSLVYLPAGLIAAGAFLLVDRLTQ